MGCVSPQEAIIPEKKLPPQLADDSANTLPSNPSHLTPSGEIVQKHESPSLHLDQAPIQPKKYQINNDNIQTMIEQSCRQINKYEAINQFNQIKSYLISSEAKNFLSLQKLAYVSAYLADLYAQIDQKEVQANQNIAYTIYDKFQTNYYEQLVVLLNNSALRNEKNKQFDKAIQKYQKIIEIQKKYYSIIDERILISRNNLACAYCENKGKQNGMKIFQQLNNDINKSKFSAQIVSLIEGNYNYYKDKNQ